MNLKILDIKRVEITWKFSYFVGNPWKEIGPLYSTLDSHHLLILSPCYHSGLLQHFWKKIESKLLIDFRCLHLRKCGPSYIRKCVDFRNYPENFWNSYFCGKSYIFQTFGVIHIAWQPDHEKCRKKFLRY